MTTMKRISRLAAAVLALSSLVSAGAEAQLSPASATTLGLAGNNTAFVREFGAISVNPAGLALPGSDFSLAIAPVQVQLGLSPVSLGDLADFEGRVIPTATKELWLDEIAAAGGETGTFGGDFTTLALTLGNIGFQLSSTVAGEMDVPVGVAEAILYGNAGRTGSATDLSLADATIESFAMTTAGLSVGFPVGDILYLGVTGKYSYGHGMAVGRTMNGALEADPIRASAEFTLVSSCFDEEELTCEQDYVNSGTGFGLDFGAMVDLGSITVGASLQNVVNQFSWDESKLAFRPGTLLIESDSTETDFDEQAFDNAPDELKTIVRDFTFKPTYRLGAALDVNDQLTVTGDIHGRFSDEGITVDPSYHVGAGAELRLGFLHLRAGISRVEEAMQYAGGGSLVLGPVNLSLAGGILSGEQADAALGQFVLSFGGR